MRSNHLRLSAATLLAACTCFAAAPAHAFTVQSGFTNGCHERISVASFLNGSGSLDLVADDQVPDGEWEEILEHLYPQAAAFGRAQRFVIFSIITGARAPDSEGFSLTNLAVLRSVQSDPAGQYIHCLRSAEDDYEEGNDTALAGCRGAIRGELEQAFDSFTSNEGFSLIEVSMTLENYGTIEVEVSPVGYHFGRALHTLQDSFTHTLRAPDLRSVVHIMNYEAAIADTLDEERDGMAHSAAADSCVTVGGVTGELVNRDRVFAAMEAGADLVRAFVRVSERRIANQEFLTAEVDAVLLKWFRRSQPEALGYEVCNMENDYCASPWLETARLSPAGPVLSCSATPNQTRIPTGLSLLCLGLMLRLAPRTFRRRGAR